MSYSEEDIVYKGAVHHGWIADSDKVVLSSFNCEMFGSDNINLDQIFICRNIFTNHLYNNALYFEDSEITRHLL